MTTQFCRLLVAVTLALTGLSAAHGQSLSDRISSAVQGSFQNQWNGAFQNAQQEVQQQVKPQWTGGNVIPSVNVDIQWPPQFTNPGVVWPQPQPCNHYIVYYYAQYDGWKHYATYHSRWQGDLAVQTLQGQGYRSYMKTVQR